MTERTKEEMYRDVLERVQHDLKAYLLWQQQGDLSEESRAGEHIRLHDILSVVDRALDE